MARLFDNAASEYLSVAQSLITDWPITMAGWAYIDESGIDHGAISLSNNAGGVIRHSVYIDTSNRVRAQSRDGAVNASAQNVTNSITLNTWNHICGVWSASDARAAFLNGGNKGTNATSVVPVGIDKFSIASFSSAGSFSGAIAEVGVWNVALSDGEVALLAKGVSPRFIRPQNLRIYAPLVREEDKDLIGGLAFTAFNTPSVKEHPRIIYPASPQIMRFAANAASAWRLFAEEGLIVSA